MGQWIFKSENVVISSVGTIFTHGLVTASPGGVSATPSGAVGETRIVVRSIDVVGLSEGGVFLSVSNSIHVIVQSASNGVRADVICQVYQSIMS